MHNVTREMTPGEALHLLENSIRVILHDVLSRELGSTWRDQVTTPSQLKNWDEAARARERSDPALPPFVDATGLAFAMYPELLNIVEAQWTHLEETFGGDADYLALLRLLRGPRRDVAHSRELVPHQAELLSGTARLFAGVAAKRMSTRDDAGEYYPVITFVLDNMGNEAVIDTPGVVAGSFSSQHTIHPGRTLTFRATGVDPQGRELTWVLYRQSGEKIAEAVAASGTTAELEWEVADKDVMENCYLNLEMSSNGQFHRAGHFDQRLFLRYTVRPLPEGLLTERHARRS